MKKGEWRSYNCNYSTEAKIWGCPELMLWNGSSTGAEAPRKWPPIGMNLKGAAVPAPPLWRHKMRTTGHE
jgi:hypothetical protein